MPTYTTLITAGELQNEFSNSDVVIVDCRFYLDDPDKGRKEYIESHIPGASYVDLNHELSSPVIKGITGRHPLPHPEILEQIFRSAGISHSSQVIAYDQSNGAYASRAWWLLRWLGHERVAVLDGGFKVWLGINGPLDNQWEIPEPGNFQMHLQSHLVTSIDEVLDTKENLIDSREHRRYTGEFEPIDPIAGHIPNAVCIPYVDNTDAEGRWRDPPELREKFSEVALKNSIPVFYCGSGVTACHNILAYKLATGKDSRLYAGSWSEWINYHPPASL
ncbi:MAG: sulfurtransferase [Saprospiraceae bacterium]